MEAILQEHNRLSTKSNLSKAVDDVQKSIDLLLQARESIQADTSAASMTLAKLQNPVKQSFDKINTDLKDVHAGLGKYQKTLDKTFKLMPLPVSEYDALSSHPNLVNRAIAMHLLREGQFSVASTFLTEAASNPPQAKPTPGTPDPQANPGSNSETLASESLQEQFTNMYYILYKLRHEHDLLPAIDWARENSERLEARGSNLEFELGRLQFVWLFSQSEEGLLQALDYARREFGGFQRRYLREIKQLSGAMAFRPNLEESPYQRTFQNDLAWEEVASSFTREFCSLLGLSADSPLYIAATAGAIALPTLLKLASIMKEKKTEWTTQDELPVEIPLPPSYHFHSIFVCPVSKEQGTEQNPPMMLPCGHVIARESLNKIGKGSHFKCPYCPMESHPHDARQVYL